MNGKYDLVVVGAGPAGAACAYHAAASGLSTLLVDRKRFPRAKVCGDGLTPRALRALARMGLEDVATTGPRIRGVRFGRRPSSPTIVYAATQPRPYDFGTVVPRLELDDRLRRAAEHAGADLVDEASATELYVDPRGHVGGLYLEHADARHQIEATVTVVADGAAGRLGRLLRRGVVPPASEGAFAVRRYVEDVAMDEAYFEIHMPVRWRERSLLGYGWVFPVTSASANVGIGLLGGYKEGADAVLRRALDEFLADLLTRDSRFEAARPIGEIEGGALNTRIVDPRDLPPGVLLVGDAAGLVNTFTGEGIAYALESGEYAARAADHARRSTRKAEAIYAEVLLGSCGRHRVRRTGTRNARWLASFGPALFADPSTILLETLQRLVLDEPARRTSETPFSEPWRTAVVASIREHLRQEIVRRLEPLDPFVAQMASDLTLGPAAAVIPALRMMGALAERELPSDPVALESLVALAFFGLAYQVLDCVSDDEHASGGSRRSPTVAAITIGDCLLTQAWGALAGLPPETYRSIADALGLAAKRRVDPRAAEQEARYAASGATAACAADLWWRAAGRAPGHDEESATLDAFARWYGSLWLAVRDLERRGSPTLAMWVETMADGGIEITGLDPSFGELARDLRREAIGLTEAFHGAARRRSASR